MSRLIPQPDRGVLLSALAQHKERQRYGVGAKCSPAMRMGKSERTDPRCYQIEYLACCKVEIGRAAFNVAAGTAATIQVEPLSAYFKPCAVTMEAVNSADSTDRTFVRISSVNIQGCPQLGIDNQAPVAGTTEVMASTVWDPTLRGGCACPVGWGTFSRLALGSELDIVVFNQNAFDSDVYVRIYGDERSTEPPCGCGKDQKDYPSTTNPGATPGRVP